MATKKPAKAATTAKKKVVAKKPAPDKPAVTVPASFVAPDWGNVLAPPVTAAPTGDAEIDAALAKILEGESSDAVGAIAERAPTSALIATYRGPALQAVFVYWNDDVVATLPPAEKRKQKKVYWAAESAKNARERMFYWFSAQLAKTPEGRAHLVEIAGNANASPRARACAAEALRESKPDAALWRAIAAAVDPVRLVGDFDVETSTWIMHVYRVGTMARLACDPAAAFDDFERFLDPSAIVDLKSEIRVKAIGLGVSAAIKECGVTPDSCARFTPKLAALLSHQQVRYAAMEALKALPPDPSVAELAQQALGPNVREVAYWDQNLVALIGKSADPKWIPWHAMALKANWMTWPGVFEGLHRIGDPVGTAVIEAWLVGTTAPDRVVAAKPLLASLYERHGPLTDAHRATAKELLATEFTAWGTIVKKKKAKK